MLEENQIIKKTICVASQIKADNNKEMKAKLSLD